MSDTAADLDKFGLYAMANVFPADSGLPMTVWVRPRSNERHGARIKVCAAPGPKMLPHDTVTVSLQPVRVIPRGGLPPADLRAVTDWIELNRAALVDHWEGRISSIEFGRRLRRLP